MAFQNQLADYAHVLRQQGGGVTKAWKPGAPPPEIGLESGLSGPPAGPAVKDSRLPLGGWR